MINPSELCLDSLPSLPLDSRAQLPPVPCIYFAIDSQGIVQYIGQTTCLLNRWQQHHRCKQLKSIGGVKIAYLLIDEPSFLVQIESALIEWFSPVLNNSAVTLGNSRVVIYLTGQLKNDLEALAAKDNRSVSNLLETVAKEIVQKAKQEGRI